MSLANANRIFALTLALSVFELGMYVCMLLGIPCDAVGARVYKTLIAIHELRKKMMDKI